jgi:hypothetical protein
MSQPPSTSQTATPSNLALLHYGQARWNVLHLRDTLDAAANAASARLWVSTFFRRLVRIFLLVSWFFGLDRTFL